MSETKMKLEIESKSSDAINDIVKCIKLYDFECKANIFSLIKNGVLISDKLNYKMLINKLREITHGKDAFIIQNPDNVYVVYVFVYR